MRSAAVAWATLACVGFLAGCGGERSGPVAETTTTFQAPDPGPVHVHGLGVNPADGALFIATHSGLFRVGPDEEIASRVGERYQDTMGFTIVGPDRFLGSGHPDLRTDEPPFLGLIASGDAGKSWRPVSLSGKADFHVLESSGRRVVGYGSDFETRREQLLVSDDGGRSWSARRAPMPLTDLAVSPADPDLWIAAGAKELMRTVDAGRTWTGIGGQAALLAWRSPRAVYGASLDGQVSVSHDGGSSWDRLGDVGGEPAAMQAEAGALYVALHTGVIRMSRDGGRTWTVRSRPRAAG